MPESRDHQRLAFGALVVGVCSYSLLQSMTVPALPHIRTALGADQADAAWILTAFLISASVATPIAGRVGDSWGKVRVLIACLLLLSLGAVGAILATNLVQMVLARVVQGLAGGVLPLAFGIVRDLLPASRVPGAVAVLSSLMSVGFGTGIVVSGPVVSHVGYRVLFLFPAVAGVAAAVCIARVVPRTVGDGRRVRLLPALLLSVWLSLGLLGVSEAPHAGWVSARTVLLLGGAAGALALWLWVEAHIDVPLIDLRLLTDGRVAGANLLAVLVGIATYGSFGFLPQLTQTPAASGYGLGASMALSGWLMLPSAVMSFVGGISSPWLRRWMGDRGLIAAGSLLTAVALGLVAFWHDQAWHLLVSNAVSGVGSGWVFASLAGIVVTGAPVGSTSAAAGLNANLRTIGGAVGSAVMATVVTRQIVEGGWPAESGYVAGFAILAAISLLAAGLALTLPGRPTVEPSARRELEPVLVQR